MVFNSFAFLIFFPVFLLLYRILPLKVRWIMMLILSLIFYMSWQADLIYLILFTTVVSYVCAIKIEKHAGNRRMQKAYMILSTSASLFVLFFFKYFNFISKNITGIINLFGGGVSDFTLNLVLPVGISFYTFQTLSYVIDTYRGSIKAERHFGYYALYVTFFPQLVAGPIERPENLIPQLKAKNPFNVNDTTLGLKFMMAGFFKKVVVADGVAKFVDAVYNSIETGDAVLVNGFTVLVATLLFAVQIYCDFSGYTDIAIGCSRVMGIRLMQNFNDPYVATSIKDFWRRWHISLTSWFTDYVYIPLGGSRCKKHRHLLNIMIVFLLSGIWHGAAWTYILWGVLHGIYQIIGNLTAKPRQRLLSTIGIKEDFFAVVWVRRIITFLLVSFAWMLFRANSISDLGVLISTLFGGWGSVSIKDSLDALELSLINIITIALSLVVLKQLDLQINTKPNQDNSALAFNPARYAVYLIITWIVVLGWIILLMAGEQSAFIYFQF